jgi:hypothetical protein
MTIRPLHAVAFGVLAISTAAIIAAAPSSAQQRPGSSLNNRWPGEPPRQDAQQPEPEENTQTTPPSRSEALTPKLRSQPAPPRVVNCSGVFAKESNHLKLATFFGSDAITWTQVDGPEGTKLNASVLYPRDPKRRLEVLWNLEASRSDTQLIVINGQSNWSGPKGLKLGLPLVAIEKLNKKPFLLRGFGGENGGMVADWEGGALASLPGGCKVSLRFTPDPKAPPAVAEVVGDKQLASNISALKPLALKVTEIILGY